MSKSKERKKVTDKKLNKELFVNFKVNADFIDDTTKEISIKVDDPRLKDTKYFRDVINGLLEDTSKLEKLKNSDKIIKLSQQFSKRLSLLQDVLKLNSPEELRKRGKKELRGHIKTNNSLGYEQFGVSSKNSFDSLLARVSLIGTCLYEKKDVFTVKKDKDGNLKAFTSDALLYPELPVQQDGKTVYVNNPNNKEYAMSGDKIERFYKQEVLGKKPKSKINADNSANSDTSGSPKETSGATQGTINNVFGEMQNTFNYFLTKEPSNIVTQILNENFSDGAMDVNDPAKILLDSDKFCKLFNTLLEVANLLNKEHPLGIDNKKMESVLKLASGVYFDRIKKSYEVKKFN